PHKTKEKYGYNVSLFRKLVCTYLRHATHYTPVLWGKAVNVAWEEGRFFDVAKAKRFLHQAVSTKATATVLWKAVLEGLQVVLKAIVGHIEALGGHLLNHLFVVVFTKWNGRNFEASEKQVTPGYRAVILKFVIELAGFSREINSVDKVAAVVFTGI